MQSENPIPRKHMIEAQTNKHSNRLYSNYSSPFLLEESFFLRLFLKHFIINKEVWPARFFISWGLTTLPHVVGRRGLTSETNYLWVVPVSTDRAERGSRQVTKRSKCKTPITHFSNTSCRVILLPPLHKTEKLSEEGTCIVPETIQSFHFVCFLKYSSSRISFLRNHL